MTARILAIDPGPVESAFVLIDADRRPIELAKVPNEELLGELDCFPTWRYQPNAVAIEAIASYGMAVGADVFTTCIWVGRFMQVVSMMSPIEPQLVFRRDVKLHHCHSAKAKDANITQALIDRFAPGVPNRGKGTKAEPGWFYGFKADIWQSYALAVYVADMRAVA